MPSRFAFVIPLVLLLGCGGEPSGPAPLRVAAASDLQEALPILAARFALDTGIKVEPVFGSSGQLAQQIKAGAPFDVFLSANRTYVDDLAKSGEIRPDSVATYTRGSLVMVVNNLYDPGIKTLADLADKKVTLISIANPDFAPYGVAAKQAIERAGLWETVKPKIVTAETVRQALQTVQTGNAEVGLVGRAISGGKGIRTIPLPPDVCDPILQGMGIIAETKQPEAAAKFAEFLIGETGQGMLKQFGFLSIPPGP